MVLLTVNNSVSIALNTKLTYKDRAQLRKKKERKLVVAFPQNFGEV